MQFDSFVLAAATADLADEPRARADADALEFRMDFAADPLAVLDAYDGDLPIIATNRVASEGGDAPATDARLDALCAAAAHPSVEAIDIELASVEDGDGERVVEAARAGDAATIVSAHDFEATPSSSAMHELLARSLEYGDVGKLAVTATDPGDVLSLLDVTWAFTTQRRDVATMAMGEPGRHSRAVAPLYGSRIGYAPVDPDRATAPGQYDLATLRSLVESLQSED